MGDEPKRVVVLGQQLASAANVERERLARGDFGASPLDPTDRYDSSSHDGEFVVLPLDTKLLGLCRSYANQDAAAREVTRRSLSMDDFYTLVAFARKAADLGLREKNAIWLADGLMALAMIELARIDWRDAIIRALLLLAAFEEIGADSTEPLRAAIRAAEPEMSELLRIQGERPAESRSFEAAGSRLVQTPSGPELLGWSGQPYAPTTPLDAVALALRALFRSRGYVAGAELATDLPDVWLKMTNDRDLMGALASVVAGATVSACSPRLSRETASQMMTIFVVETAQQHAAQTLQRLAIEKQAMNNDFALAAAQCGRLFGLLVARSFVAGVESSESNASLARFLPEIEAILRACPQPEVQQSSSGLVRGFWDFVRRRWPWSG